MQNISPRAQTVLRLAVVWDNHACMPLRADACFLPQLKRYREAGVSVVSLNVGFAEMSWAEHVRILAFMRQWIALRPGTYHLLSAVEDVRRSKAEGKLGIVFDIEGMCHVQKDLNVVQTFYELVVRWMLIACNRNNAAGGGCLDADSGLIEAGRAIIDEMERVGGAFEYSRNPAIFSHSHPYRDTPHARKIPDVLMRACARKDGVIGLSGIGPFLGAHVNLVEHLLHQLRYVIDLIGAEHVGLGLDYVFDRTELHEYLRLNPRLFPPAMNIAGGMGWSSRRPWAGSPRTSPETISPMRRSAASSVRTGCESPRVCGGSLKR